jgi:hypothetical protein
MSTFIDLRLCSFAVTMDHVVSRTLLVTCAFSSAAAGPPTRTVEASVRSYSRNGVGVAMRLHVLRRLAHQLAAGPAAFGPRSSDPSIERTTSRCSITISE